MKWNKDVKEIPPCTEVLILTDLGEVLIAMRSRKNSKRLILKNSLFGKIEWLPSETISLAGIVYWSRIDKLTKRQHDAVYEPNPNWDKLFEY